MESDKTAAREREEDAGIVVDPTSRPPHLFRPIGLGTRERRACFGEAATEECPQQPPKHNVVEPRWVGELFEVIGGPRYRFR